MISRSINLVTEKINTNDMTEAELLQAPDLFFENINAIDVLDLSNNENILIQICNKLKSGGSLYIKGLDGISLCRKISTGEIPLDQFNTLLKSIKRLHSLNLLKNIFVEQKWKINFLSQENTDSRYSIQIIKP